MAETGRVTLLIQFARAPLEGSVKTRMMPHLNARQACELHRELVLWTSRTLVRSGLGDVELAVSGDRGDALFGQCRALGVGRLSPQRGTGLGERMYEAIRCGLQRYQRVLLVGSDCPSIDVPYLESALRALDNKPMVLGPALDGGYVLIGARTPRRTLFEGIDWGTGRVYDQTIERLVQEGLDWDELPALPDVDRPADLAHWQAIMAKTQ